MPDDDMPDPAMPGREQRIRERAYHLWQAAGCPDDRAEQFWQQAMAEDGSAAAPVVPAPGEIAGTAPGAPER